MKFSNYLKALINSPEKAQRALKSIVFSFIVVITAILLINKPSKYYVILPCCLSLLVLFVVKNGAIKTVRTKVFLYILDYIVMFVMSYFVGTNLISTLYLTILTDFYLTATSFRSNVIMGFISFAAFVVGMVLSGGMSYQDINVLLSAVFNEFTIFLLVFTIVNLLAALMKKQAETLKAYDELKIREQKLQEAYKSVEEVSKLEERTRIAKEMHDTIGHSMTVITLQTESALAKIDTDPESAKAKLSSAHNQAVEALKELRDSVHVLSGDNEDYDITIRLNKIVADTMSDTGIVIRTKIEDALDVSREAGEFICNALKEGINNGLRHGKSTAFYFELIKKDGRLEFLLSDNGGGAEKIKEGYGLSSMRKKAESLGGRMYFSSFYGEGFEIHISLPLKKPL